MLMNTLKKFGLTQLESQECNFKFRDDMHQVTLVVYVDDLLILSPELCGVKSSKEELRSLFKLTDLQELTSYLGAPFEQIGYTKFTGQSAYCIAILKQLRMEMVKMMPTPMVENMKQLFLKAAYSETEQKEGRYFSLVVPN